MIYTCSPKKVKYFHGYVYSENYIPLEGLKITNQYDLSIGTYTDEKGYFRITKGDNFKGRFLYVYLDANKIDSIQVSGVQGGEKINYSFVNGRMDTLFIKIPNKDPEK
ncbi:hypothetical protein GCM10009117_02590 [Gangjinia marincola]|uniref:Carboxypeptidase regulatory-like domain-containing protein n=2 Tax=Gangjinia marincola TaxID=578463 RepID=A0ABN1MDE9_9FLAO